MFANLKSLRVWGLVFGLSILLAACRAPIITVPQAPTPDLNALYTQVAGTLIAQGQVPSPTVTIPTSAFTQTPFVVTATFSPTPLTPSATPSNTPVPATNTPAVVCNQAAFIKDVTVPDGTVMSKGQTFTKTWRIKNTGTCTWNSSYDIVFSSGTNLASNSSYDLPEQVDPNETVDISVPMKAPNSNDTYKSNWVLRSDTGTTFGVGGGGGVPVFALIKVGSGGGNIQYSLVANYCDANWESGTNNSLPCPGTNSGTQGFVIRLNNPDLENKQENEPAIWVRPNHANSGYIEGLFPDYMVQSGDHFVATIGCLDNNNNCRVQFTLSYRKNNGTVVQLGTWDEKSDGLVTNIDFNLSSLAGTEINFILLVETNNSSFSEANAFWFMPLVTNP